MAPAHAQPTAPRGCCALLGCRIETAARRSDAHARPSDALPMAARGGFPRELRGCPRLLTSRSVSEWSKSDGDSLRSLCGGDGPDLAVGAVVNRAGSWGDLEEKRRRTVKSRVLWSAGGAMTSSGSTAEDRDCKMKLSSSWIRLQKITQKIGKSHKSFGNVLRPSEVFLRLLGLQGNEGSKDNHILRMVASGKVESSGAFACLRHWETPTCSQALQLQIPFSDMLPCGRLELGGRRQP
ncbi:hypothetical protein MUK42_06245 [Musa troglodytarum]|uniref:Uncharacterized protein n=1 Tax=Musa troglodytarum TaxID=320322 RepID=A0A9E7K925_9LILI|nr:hypothetical protein MUK42_06245 [Musa troglodytarum]